MIHGPAFPPCGKRKCTFSEEERTKPPFLECLCCINFITRIGAHAKHFLLIWFSVFLELQINDINKDMAQYIRPVYVPSPPFSVPKSVRRAFKLFRNLAKVPVADVLQRKPLQSQRCCPSHTQPFPSQNSAKNISNNTFLPFVSILIDRDDRQSFFCWWQNVDIEKAQLWYLRMRGGGVMLLLQWIVHSSQAEVAFVPIFCFYKLTVEGEP